MFFKNKSLGAYQQAQALLILYEINLFLINIY